MKEFLGKIGKFFKKMFNRIGLFFHALKERIVHNKIFVLVMMQLKDKWNISWKANKKAALIKSVSYILVFAAMIFIVHLILDLSATRLGIFMTQRIPLNAMLPILLVVVFFETFSTLIGLTKALFFSKDNSVLITYPVKFNYLFISKVIVYYIDALKKSCMLLLPLFISFGMIYSYGVAYYFFIVFMDLVFVAFIVLLCGVLSIPTYYVLRFLEKYKIIKYAFSFIVVGALIFGTIKLIGLIPENINIVREYEQFSMGLNKFLYWFKEHFFVTAAVGQMFFGVLQGLTMRAFSVYSWSVMLCLIAATGVLLVSNMLLAKPFYRRTISTNSKDSSTGKKVRKNHRLFKWISVLHYEFVRNFRDEKIVIASIICVVAMPLISLFANRFYNSFTTRSLGDTLIYVFNFLFIMIVVTSHNTSSSYIFSKDGPSWTVNKTMPVGAKTSLPLRLVYNFIVSLLIIIPASIIFFNSEHAGKRNCLLFILTLVVLSTLHSVLSASYDYSHSKNKDKADIGSEIVGTHTAVSLVYGFLLAIFFGLFIVICSLRGATNLQVRVLVLATVLLGLGVLYFFRNIHLTYQEN